MSEKLRSVTAVIVIDDQPVARTLLQTLSDRLAAEAVDFDIVLVASGVRSEVTLALKELVEAHPDTTAVFLAERVHPDIARLVGVDHAVGDYVLFCSPTEAEIAALPALFKPLREGYDLVMADQGPAPEAKRPLLARLLFEIYLWTYRKTTGLEFGRNPTGLRVLSRAAALYLSGRADAEILMRATSIGPGFPTASIPLPDVHGAARQTRAIGDQWSKGLRLLLSVSSLPLRTASYVSLAAGILSAIYTIYIVLIFLFKKDLIQGWTTISLQIAGMMFLFSLIFMFLSEYVIIIHAANPPHGRRHLVTREIRSQLSRRSARLNVIDSQGAFQVGAAGAAGLGGQGKAP
jgi:hypothetical protein